MPKRDRTIFTPKPPVWKIKDMITKLGGVGGMSEKLIAKGFFPPGADTVQGWVTRNSIPGAWSPAVFSLAQDAGLIEGPMDALVRDFQIKNKRRTTRQQDTKMMEMIFLITFVLIVGSFLSMVLDALT